ncbi:hypothetical protein OS493_004229 [Desmophyllum pertusum]|uniref:Uncharacterized protein n=1 Tax=Desmophyllum pertusum TaxID=174260 RepID=A0A9X0D6A7_9CNID|nr:hypothetical protein OS493_004229 [Desmophyllum pertusum]
MSLDSKPENSKLIANVTSGISQTKDVEIYLSFGNDQMDENTAKEIVSQVWTQIQSKNPGKYLNDRLQKYSLQHTLNVEENHDQGTGDRYLVELETKRNFKWKICEIL